MLKAESTGVAAAGPLSFGADPHKQTALDELTRPLRLAAFGRPARDLLRSSGPDGTSCIGFSEAELPFPLASSRVALQQTIGQSNGPMWNTMLAIASAPIANTTIATISVNETG